MEIIYTIADLQEFVKKLERQKDILSISRIFTPVQKIEISEIYDNQIMYLNSIIAFHLDVKDAIQL